MDQPSPKPHPELGAIAEYWKRKWERAAAIMDAFTSPQPVERPEPKREP